MEDYPYTMNDYHREMDELTPISNYLEVINYKKHQCKCWFCDKVRQATKENNEQDKT